MKKALDKNGKTNGWMENYWRLKEEGENDEESKTFITFIIPSAEF